MTDISDFDLSDFERDIFDFIKENGPVSHKEIITNYVPDAVCPECERFYDGENEEEMEVRDAIDALVHETKAVIADKNWDLVAHPGVVEDE